MARKRRRGKRSKRQEDFVLPGLLGLVLGGSLLIFGVGQCPRSSWRALDSTTIQGSLVPKSGARGDSSRQCSESNPSRAEVRLYLDTSQPMGGFLGSGEQGNLFRSWFKRTQVELFQAYEGNLAWYRVDQGAAPLGAGPLGAEPRLESEQEFQGGSSNLNCAVEQIREGLVGGTLDGAALVTDLVPTRQINGAVALIESLRPLLEDPRMRSGALDLGLFSVRIPYRGVSAGGSCRRPGAGEPGCWFSEDDQTWRPLTTMARRPLHVLVIGRSGRSPQAAQAESRVHQVGMGLREFAESLGSTEYHWELLSSGLRAHPAELECRAEEEQHALWIDESSAFRCQQEAKVPVTCTVSYAASGIPGLPESLRIDRWQASWQDLYLRAIPGSEDRPGLGLEIDCAAIRGRPPEGDLTLRLGLSGRWSSDLASWSTHSDSAESDLDKTLELVSFLEGVRPGAFELEPEGPVLKTLSRPSGDDPEPEP